MILLKTILGPTGIPIYFKYFSLHNNKVLNLFCKILIYQNIFLFYYFLK